MMVQTLTFIVILLSVSIPSKYSSYVHAFQQSHPWVTTTSIRSLSSVSSSTSRTTTTTLLKESSSSYYSIESDNSGPGSGPVHRLIIHKLPGQKEEVEDDNENNDDDKSIVVVEGTTHTNGETESEVIEDSNGETSPMEDAAPPVKQQKPEKQHPIVIETGRIGRQAAGAVSLTRGDTVLYATAARDESPRDGLDFVPLSVEHQERFSSVGQTSGGYLKRDGRPAEHEVLTCRLIDRPLRPLIAAGWRHETQLLSWVLSYDGVRSCDPLAIVASATALYISDVPLTKAVAAAMVGYDRETDTLMLNPTTDEMAKSQLQLIVAGTKDAVLMIEGAADFLPEETMVRAVKFGHDAIRVICEAVEEFGKVVGKEKNFETLARMPDGLQERVDGLMSNKVDRMFEMGGTKTTQGPVKKQLQNELIDALSAETEEHEYVAADIKNAFKDLLCRRMFVRAKETGKRCDGRNLDEIRELTMEAGFLPRVHGSALFTRGETQVVATSTLGDSGMRKKIDTIDGAEEKRFYLQYSFPPSCVGETGRVGAPGRREIGHGNLAERALIPALPTEEEFPYTIRVESLVTESHGSSSMASVCGGCLALMDAGVPIKRPIAGIAMGMLLGEKDSVSDENSVILSDILGTEDALGTMDFKVAGDREGITTFQLDIKCEGLTLETMERALEQARKGRLHILDAMNKVLPNSRSSLPETVPKLAKFSINPESIGKVIGPGGKQIRAIIEDFGLSNMNVEDDGSVQVSAFNEEKLKEAEEFIKLLISSAGGRGSSIGRAKKEPRPEYAGPEPVEGQVYSGKITGIHPFGVFLEFMPGAEDGSTPGLEGLCHVSDLAQDRVRNCEGFIKSLNVDGFDVVYLGINKSGKRQVSRKAVLDNSPRGRSTSNGKAGESVSSSQAPAEPSMSEQEVAVIAEAIKGIQNL